MLHILCLILEIIGIVLLCILGSVLFVPIRYRLKLESENRFEDLNVEARATWLFHLAYASVSYEKEKLMWKLRVGWKKYHTNEKMTEWEEAEESEEIKNPKKSEKIKKKRKTEGKTESKKETKKESRKEEKKSENKFTYTIFKICDKIKEIKAFLTEETHIQAFLCLKKELYFLLKKVKPDKMKGFLRFGFEDPYDTGRILAGLSVLYPIYGECVQIYPEFDKEVLEGNLIVKGRIHVIHLLIVFLRIYRDKNVRTAYHHFQERKE